MIIDLGIFFFLPGIWINLVYISLHLPVPKLQTCFQKGSLDHTWVFAVQQNHNMKYKPFSSNKVASTLKFN